MLFLDEPTTGLDPRSRNDLWELLRERVRGGTTIVLTTQYLEEADQLADDIVVLDHGVVAARGTPAELKLQVGGDRIVVTVADQVARAQTLLAPFGEVAIEATEAPNPQGIAVSSAPTRVVIRAKPGLRLVEVMRALDSAGIDAIDVARRETTLHDVFLSITGPKKPAPAIVIPSSSPPEVRV